MTVTRPYLKLTDRAPLDAPWMVLVHGVSQDHRIFDAQVAAFARAFRLLLIDLPGHGRAAALAGPYGIAENAAHIEAILARENVRGAVFWGTHLGATSGLVLAARAPDRFAHLLLEAPVFPGRALACVSDLIARVAVVLDRDGLDAALALWWAEGPWFDAIRADPATCRAAEQWEIVRGFGGGPWRETGLLTKPLGPVEARLAALNLPVEIINGTGDHPDFLSARAALCACLPAARVHDISGAGGFPAWERPAEVNALVAGLLASNSSLEISRGARGAGPSP